MVDEGTLKTERNTVRQNLFPDLGNKATHTFIDVVTGMMPTCVLVSSFCKKTCASRLRPSFLTEISTHSSHFCKPHARSFLHAAQTRTQRHPCQAP